MIKILLQRVGPTEHFVYINDDELIGSISWKPIEDDFYMRICENTGNEMVEHDLWRDSKSPSQNINMCIYMVLSYYFPKIGFTKPAPKIDVTWAKVS